MIDFKKTKEADVVTYMEKYDTVNNNLINFFDKERSIWADEINLLYPLLYSKNLDLISKLQADNLGLRHRIQDSITKYLNRLSGENMKYKKMFADRMEYYVFGYGAKSSSAEKTKLIDRDLAQKKRSIEILEVHIEHLKELRYQCDQINFGIKNISGLLAYLV